MKKRIHQRLAGWGMALLAGLFVQPMLSHAGTTDLADKPLFAAKGTMVKPNVLFMLDDSGSMAWDFMPDDVDYDASWNNSTNREYTRNKMYGRRASQCNGVAFNPEGAVANYVPPIDATGASIGNASTDFLSGTIKNGAPNYLSSGYVYHTTNINSVSSPASSSVKVLSSGSVTVTVGGSYSSYHVGMVVSLINASGGYWDNSRYMIGKVTGWNSSTGSLTIGVEMGVGVGSYYSAMYVGVGSPIDNVYYVYKGTQKPLSYDYGTGTLNKKATFYQECASLIGSDTGKAVFDAVIVKPVGATDAETKLIQAYANWYYYYSTRMNMMKTSMRLAFKELNSDVRVGFDSINRNTHESLLDVSDFDLAQKTAFYERIVGAKADNSTPLRAALALSGRYYAKKLTGQTYDPVQYSCQKHFTLLSTDGYWNNASGYKIDGSTDVGQQDGAGTPNPYYDGGNVSETLTETWTVKNSRERTTVTPYKRKDTTEATSYNNTGQRYTTYRLSPYFSNNAAATHSCAAAGPGKYKCTITITTSTATPISDGDSVKVSGLTPAYFDTFSAKVSSVSGRSFSYSKTLSGLSSPPPAITTTGVSYYQSGKCSLGQGTLTRTDTTRDLVQKTVVTSSVASDWTSTRVDEVNTTVTTYTRLVTYSDGVVISDTTTSSVAPVADKLISGPTASAVKTTSTDPTSVTTSSYTSWVSNDTYDCATSAPAAEGSETSPVTTAATTPVPDSTTNTSTTGDVPGTSTVTYADPVVTTSPKTSTSTTTTTTGSQDSLADVAMYYYKTDLRTPELGNCTGALGTPVCDNNVPTSPSDPANWQHLNTLTLSLGMSGRLLYQADYDTNTASVFAKIKSGDVKWPIPDGGAANIDDLWHAAVNGRGRYFSAREPSSLAASLKSALATVMGALGSSSAAATSTLQPVEGDRGVYVAQFKSVEWWGDLQSFLINPTTGAIESTSYDSGKPLPMWSANALLSATTARKIYYKSAASDAVNGLKEFNFGNLDADGLGSYFSGACSKLPVLSQCADATADTKTVLNSGAKMVSFLRGQPVTEFRMRIGILGDIVNSSPVYVAEPRFNYTDSKYDDFRTAQKSRGKTLYVGANDGMLHAFNAVDGTERWAYVPRLVMPNLYRLGERNYGDKHFYTVDATPVVGDVFDGTNWRTILVAGLNGGGKGYFALDVTDPSEPKALWEFTNGNLGFSYGNPVITKRKDGTWVVAFTSGYNNADGDGHLFVVKATDGSLLEDIKTGAGSPGSPSGLAKLNAWVDLDSDNTATRFYAGDLLGNIWRFDIDGNLEPKKAAFKLAQLLKGSTPQPITTRLELAEIEASGGKHVVVYAGTGRYLGVSDIPNEDVQSVYAITDALGKDSLGDVRGAGVLVKQTLASSGGKRTIDPAVPVDWSSKKGWYVDLIDKRERVNVDMQLAFNKLTVAGNVPNDSAADCAGGGGGTAWIYQLDVISGKLTNGSSVSAMVAGLSSVQLSDGTGASLVTKSDATTPEVKTIPPSVMGSGSARRSSWRELID